MQKPTLRIEQTPDHYFHVIVDNTGLIIESSKNLIFLINKYGFDYDDFLDIL